jgi:hypothetical protein
MDVMNSVTPKAAAKHDLLFNKPASERFEKHKQWGSTTHQMPAPFPGLSWCILFTLYVFQKE